MGSFINIALGVWLMAAPDVFEYGDPARTNDQVVGPLVVSVAIMAIREVLRPLRWVNLVLRHWLVVAPMPLDHPIRVAIQSVVIGLAVATLSFVRGVVKERMGGGWSALWKSNAMVREEG